MVLVVELLSTAIEWTVDRMGTDWHALSDMASAAVLVSLVFCLGIGASAGWRRLSG